MQILLRLIDLEISEPFELNFNKEKVIDNGFKEAFEELSSLKLQLQVINKNKDKT